MYQGKAAKHRARSASASSLPVVVVGSSRRYVPRSLMQLSSSLGSEEGGSDVGEGVGEGKGEGDDNASDADSDSFLRATRRKLLVRA